MREASTTGAPAFVNWKRTGVAVLVGAVVLVDSGGGGVRVGVLGELGGRVLIGRGDGTGVLVSVSVGSAVAVFVAVGVGVGGIGVGVTNTNGASVGVGVCVGGSVGSAAATRVGLAALVAGRVRLQTITASSASITSTPKAPKTLSDLSTRAMIPAYRADDKSNRSEAIPSNKAHANGMRLVE